MQLQLFLCHPIDDLSDVPKYKFIFGVFDPCRQIPEISGDRRAGPSPSTFAGKNPEKFESTCEWEPSVILTLTLNLEGRDRISLTRIVSPISVAIEQCGIVGVNVKSIVLFSSSTVIRSSLTTLDKFK